MGGDPAGAVLGGVSIVVAAIALRERRPPSSMAVTALPEADTCLPVR